MTPEDWARQHLDTAPPLDDAALRELARLLTAGGAR